MRLLILDITSAYTANSPYEAPLGGTQAAACYLAAELAKCGVQVDLVNQHSQPAEFFGVRNLSPAILDSVPEMQSVDAIILNGRWKDSFTRILKKRSSAPLIGWMHEACFSDPFILPAAEFSAFVFVSEWQQKLNASHIPPHITSRVIPNGIAPAFHHVQPAPKATPVAVYSGSSKRGLLDLPQIIPQLKNALPMLEFQVFSDCVVSQNPDDTKSFMAELQALPGVTHVGAVSQNELPARLAAATFFISPNTYPETFCIALAEAMAAGLHPIITNRAALPSTAAGFADIIPIPQPGVPDWSPGRLDTHEFSKQAAGAMQRWLTDPEQKTKTEKQISYARQHYNWAAHAKTWLELLQQLRGEF